VQLATFANAKQADQAAAEARKQGVVAQSVRDPENSSHVLLRVGPFPSYAEAVALKARFASMYPNAVIIP
jgi:cell division septation protein DedD